MAIIIIIIIISSTMRHRYLQRHRFLPLLLECLSSILQCSCRWILQNKNVG